jgi:hypothetical protein
MRLRDCFRYQQATDAAGRSEDDDPHATSCSERFAARK